MTRGPLYFTKARSPDKLVHLMDELLQPLCGQKPDEEGWMLWLHWETATTCLLCLGLS